MVDISADNFNEAGLNLFKHQYNNNAIYRKYCDALRINADAVNDVCNIPYLPISFFKTHTVTTGIMESPAALVFESSGTTGEAASRHYITDAGLYERSLLHGFVQYYGPPADYAILALLPSYLERGNSSLVYMAKTLMQMSGHADNGFYINEWGQLATVIRRLEAEGQKILLLGVTFALLDFADKYPMALQHTVVMETGGMKGRREELTRTEVHDILKDRWQLSGIHSEYGMTELLSQAYSPADGIFKCTATMKALVRDINDPFDISMSGAGALNVIDVANVNSCAFIATDDLARIARDGTFEVLGRMDHSLLRGCSLMAV